MALKRASGARTPDLAAAPAAGRSPLGLARGPLRLSSRPARRLPRLGCRLPSLRGPSRLPRDRRGRGLGGRRGGGRRGRGRQRLGRGRGIGARGRVRRRRTSARCLAVHLVLLGFGFRASRHSGRRPRASTASAARGSPRFLPVQVPTLYQIPRAERAAGGVTRRRRGEPRLLAGKGTGTGLASPLRPGRAAPNMAGSFDQRSSRCPSRSHSSS
jgi:hypothetical protein